ncbi:GatB/YqeY domain-containing protein, partial [Arthrospira platensis SPKY1]|nr:GatB/YqeY domain-containing protein [Arthrospira platensis SPKY1]
LTKAAKQRKDSIEQFSAAGRTDLADRESAELAIIESYLPKQLSEDEIKALVVDAIQQSGASGPGDMGKVMGILMPKVKGKADGGLVNKVVKEHLNP